MILCIGVSFILTVYFWLNGTLGYSENLKYLTIYEVKDNISESNISRTNVGILNYKHVPNTVHYVWCGERCFQFNHYLSMKSVLKEIKPDLIIFHYEVLPIYDTFIYNTWFDELKKEFPFIYVKAAKEENQTEPAVKMCLSPTEPNPEFINIQLTEHGGIYVHEQTVLLQFPSGLRKYDFIKGTDRRTGYGFLLAKKGFPGNMSINDMFESSKYKTGHVQCISHKSLTILNDAHMCINIVSPINPRDIWRRNDVFGQVTRTLFYGSPDIIPEAKPNYTSLIPNIAHMVWLGGGEMDFLFFLSVLSLLHVVKVDTVYIHGDAPPSGPYWERVKNHPRLEYVFREAPHTVYGTKVKVSSHVSDIWRVDFMIKYGGIYIDTNALFVKPLNHFIRGFDAIATYDWVDWNAPFPDVINFGVMAGKKNATYWHHFQKSMNWFLDEDWAWNGLRRPYSIQLELILISKSYVFIQNVTQHGTQTITTKIHTI